MTRGFRSVGELASSAGAQKLEEALHKRSREEPSPVRKRQGGLVADRRHVRLPHEFLAYAGALGIPAQAQLMYIHVARYDIGKGKPYVGLDTVAGAMGMTRQAAMRWLHWWQRSGLLVTRSKGRKGVEGVTRSAPERATEWDFSPLWSLLWEIKRLEEEKGREAKARLRVFLQEKRAEIEKAVVNRSCQPKRGQVVNERCHMVVNFCDDGCKPVYERLTTSNPARPQKSGISSTESDDINNVLKQVTKPVSAGEDGASFGTARDKVSADADDLTPPKHTHQKRGELEPETSPSSGGISDGFRKLVDYMKDFVSRRGR